MIRSVIFGFCLLGSAMGAETDLVNWGGRYIHVATAHDDNHGSNVLNLGDDTVLTDESGAPIGLRFQAGDAAPLSPVVDVYDNGAPSAVFFGVVEYLSRAPVIDSETSIRGFTRVRSGREEGNDYVQFRANRTDGHEGRWVGLLYWRKDDFLNGWNEVKAISLTSLTRLSATFPRRNKPGPGGVRFAVRNGDKWYLSSERAERIDDEFRLQAATWGEWDPAQMPLPPPPEDYAVPAGSLTDITAVGLFFDMSEGWSLDGFRAVAQQ